MPWIIHSFTAVQTQVSRSLTSASEFRKVCFAFHLTRHVTYKVIDAIESVDTASEAACYTPSSYLALLCFHDLHSHSMFTKDCYAIGWQIMGKAPLLQNVNAICGKLIFSLLSEQI
jgi:urate oxidase